MLLCPLGLYLPAKFHAGSAWGEWGSAEVKREVARETRGQGYVPTGLVRAEKSGWKAPLPDYALPRQKSTSLSKLSLSYLLSGALGVGGLVLLLLATRCAWARKDRDGTTAVDAHGD